MRGGGSAQKSGGAAERKIRLKSVNPHITCSICGGYMVDATTITECLHTFCKTCIVKHLGENVHCPKCHIIIHQSHPLQYVSHDRTMQDIVYKLVPHLYENECKRIEDFYKSRGLPLPRSQSVNDEKENAIGSGPEGAGQVLASPGCGVAGTVEKTERAPVGADSDYHMSDEQVNVCMDCSGGQLKSLKRRYIRCSVQTTITHLKKFLALKLYKDIHRFRDVDVLCNEELLGKDHTLKFIIVTRWRNKDDPLQLAYRPRVDL